MSRANPGNLQEVLVALPERWGPATHIRGTVLGSSSQAVRTRGLIESYRAALPERYHRDFDELIPQSWVPISFAVAHYTVMDQLLGPDEARELGRDVAMRVHKSYLGTLIRSARSTGVASPLTILRRLDTIYGRMAQGGAVMARQVGPKDVIAEVHGIALARIPYYRAGMEGIFESSLGLIAKKVYARSEPIAGDGVRTRLSWV